MLKFGIRIKNCGILCNFSMKKVRKTDFLNINRKKRQFQIKCLFQFFVFTTICWLKCMLCSFIPSVLFLIIKRHRNALTDFKDRYSIRQSTYIFNVLYLLKPMHFAWSIFDMANRKIEYMAQNNSLMSENAEILKQKFSFKISVGWPILWKVGEIEDYII